MPISKEREEKRAAKRAQIAERIATREANRKKEAAEKEERDKLAATPEERSVKFSCDGCKEQVDKVSNDPNSSRFLCDGCMPEPVKRRTLPERPGPVAHSRPECEFGTCPYPDRCKRDDECHTEAVKRDKKGA